MEETEEQQHTLTVQTDKLLHATKAELNSKISHAVQLVKSGEVDKMQAYIYAKKLESLGKDLAKGLKELADDTTIQRGGITMFNAMITQGEQGVKWDYTTTGDKEWQDLEDKMAELKIQKDAREKFLQSITKPLELVDIESGETYSIKPPIKSGSLGLTIKIK